MTKTIQQLRKDAGFRTAREFAQACGFTPSTLARYERDSESVPVKSAWKMADVLGCSIDDVVGRESEITADLRGDVQIRVEALPPSLQSLHEDFLEYLESRAGEAQEAAGRRWDGRYIQAAKRYIATFFEQCYPKDAIIGARVRPGEVRERFGEYLVEQFEDSELDPQEKKEVIDELMDAYDALDKGLV